MINYLVLGVLCAYLVLRDCAVVYSCLSGVAVVKGGVWCFFGFLRLTVGVVSVVDRLQFYFFAGEGLLFGFLCGLRISDREVLFGWFF